MDDQNPSDYTTQPTTPDDLDPEDQKHEDSKPPSVTGEEDISGDTPVESPDIDNEMAKFGEDIDPEHPTPLGEE